MKILLLKDKRIKWNLFVRISKQKNKKGLFLPSKSLGGHACPSTSLFLSTTERVSYSPANVLRKIRETTHGQRKLVKRYITGTLVPVCISDLYHFNHLLMGTLLFAFQR